jgi:8-oxo-dGTP pyrophosphatase MutT (NUDIX family)
VSHVGNIEKLAGVLNQESEKWDATAAVVVLLKEANQDVQVLFVKRAEKLGDPWSGQTAFPGGKCDPEDCDLKETVVRETLEETGMNLLEGCRFLGAMEAVRSTRKPEMRVLPFVVLLEQEQQIELNEELSDYFWAPLKEFAKHQGTAKLSDREQPAYIIDEHIIWGLTYRILQQFLSLFSSVAEIKQIES